MKLDFFRVIDQLLSQLGPQLVNPLRMAGHLGEI